MATELLQLPDCQWDEWSLSMRAAHPELAGDDFFAKLAFTSCFAWKDISGVEARHATVRRHLSVASLQTHQETLQTLSAHWCFRQARKASARAATATPTSVGGSRKVAGWSMHVSGLLCRVHCTNCIWHEDRARFCRPALEALIAPALRAHRLACSARSRSTKSSSPEASEVGAARGGLTFACSPSASEARHA